MAPEFNFQTGARELRALLGRSQQAMAASLGLSMAALRNYEAGKAMPEARAAVAYMMAADAAGLGALAQVFADALEYSIGIPLEGLADAIYRIVVKDGMGLA